MSFWSDLLRILAGGKPKPKPPVVLPPLGPIQINCGVTGKATDTPTLIIDNAHVYVGQWESPTRVIFMLPGSEPDWGATFTFGGKTLRYVIPDKPGAYEGPALDYTPAFVPLPVLVTRGQFFALDTGAPWTAIQCSDFNLLHRSHAGEDIEPVLAQRGSVGFNLLRVWTAYSIGLIGRLVPRDRPGLYAHIPAFLQKCARHGLYVEFTGFTGPYNGILDTDDEKVAHWEALLEGCRGQTNVILELVNEADNAPNRGLPMDRLRNPPMLTASHGSNIQDAMPVEPFWDYATYRAAAGEWQRKIGHNADEMSDTIPVITNETPRCPDHDRDPNHFQDGAAGAALLCAGACFHSVHGKDSTLWKNDANGHGELECAQAWVKGAKSVPLGCQPGGYAHRTDLETDQIIRAYQRGGDPACIVRIRA